MAGHSKFKNIQFRKGAQDKKRSKLFSKLAREITRILRAPDMADRLVQMGVDRILFAVDWPYVENRPGTEWMERLSLSREDKEKILNGNAKRLLKM